MKEPLTIENTIREENEDPDPRRNAQKRGLVNRLLFWRRDRQQQPQMPVVPEVQPIGQTQAHHVMVKNVARLMQARVDDVMIARSEIEAIEIGTTLGEALMFFERSGHSRLPVYAETLDDPRGMVHIRDLLSFITQTARRSGAEQSELDFALVDLKKPIGEIDIIREVLFVPASMRASQLLSRMQSTRTQMALVIDEFGGTDGLASMEDVFELVVGDIEDEHDDDDVMITAQSADCWLIDARAELEEIAKYLGEDLDWGELGEDVDTIGGLIVSKLDHIPQKGETVTMGLYRFEVVEADHRRIQRVRMRNLYSERYAKNQQG